MTAGPKLEFPQGEPLFNTTWRAVSEAFPGIGIRGKADFEITTTATALQLSVSSGGLWYPPDDTTYSFGGGTVTLSSGDSTYDRWDLIYYDVDAGVVDVREGSAVQYPEVPDLNDREVLLGYAYVENGANDILASDVFSWRVLAREASDTRFEGSGDYTASNVEQALVTDLAEAVQLDSYPLSLSDLDTPFTLGSLSDGDLDGTDLSDSSGPGTLYDASAGEVNQSVLGGPASDLSSYPLSLSDLDTPFTLTDLGTELGTSLDASSLSGSGINSTVAPIQYDNHTDALAFLSRTLLPSSPPTNFTYQIADFLANDSGIPLVTRIMELDTDGSGNPGQRRYKIQADLILLLAQSEVQAGFTVTGTTTVESDIEDSNGNTVYDESNGYVPSARMASPQGDISNYPLERGTDYDPDLRTTVSSSDYTVGSGEDIILIDDLSASRTVTLGSGTKLSGRTIRVKDAAGNASTNSLDITDAKGTPIDGSSTESITTDYGSRTLVNEGANWYIVD